MTRNLSNITPNLNKVAEFWLRRAASTATGEIRDQADNESGSALRPRSSPNHRALGVALSCEIILAFAVEAIFLVHSSLVSVTRGLTEYGFACAAFN